MHSDPDDKIHAANSIGHPDEFECVEFNAENAWGPCDKCGKLLGEHPPTGEIDLGS